MHCWWESRLVQPLWKAVQRYVKKLEMDLPVDLSSPESSVCSVVAETRQIHTDYQVLWRKGTARPLSQEESAATLALTGFYCFSGSITSRMVLVYYAQVRCRWLPFTENKGEYVANYIKKEGYLQR